MITYTFLQIALIAAGILCLAYGADKLVEGATKLGEMAGLSKLVIGLTIVAIGTSLPELFVSLFAASKGQSGLALGNIVGSNIFNLGAILGVTALIYPITIKHNVLRQEIPLMCAVTALIAIPILLNLEIGTPIGLLLLGIFGGFLFLLKHQSGTALDNTPEEAPATPAPKSWPLKPLLGIILGCALLYIGSEGLVMGAVNLATLLGVSPTIIGLTIVSAGTSSPEIFACIACALKKNSDMAVGNIIGSNIFNIILILGLTATFFPIGAGTLKVSDALVLLGITLVTLPFAYTKLTINRTEGGIFVLAYLGYLWLCWPK